MSKKPKKSSGNGVHPEAEAKTSTILELAAGTLTGDVRDAVLDLIRGMDQPWTKLSEVEQRRKIDAASRLAGDLVRGVVDIVAHREFPHLPIRAGKWTVKDGEIAIALGTLATVEAVSALIRHSGSGVLVLADASAFMGERRPAKPQPDQPDLPIGEAASGDALPLDEARAAFEATADKAPTPAEADTAAERRATRRRKAREHVMVEEEGSEPLGDVAERVVGAAAFPETPAEPATVGA